jgi:hypothetical protein
LLKAEVYGMNIIKLILAALGLVFGVMIVFWVLGFVWSLIWYLLFFGIIGALGYGGYKLFRKAEARALRSDTHAGLSGMDVNMSWDEYDKKYLHK